MSDPTVKGVKRTSSRSPTKNASAKSSAKGSKVTAKSARPKPKTSAAEKAPVRKATPAKAAAKSSPSKSAAPAKKSAKTTAVSKKAASGTKKGQRATPTKGSTAKGQKTPAKAPNKTTAKAKAPEKGRTPAKAAPQQASKAQHPAKAAPRPAPPPPKKPTSDEAAALKTFERAHKEFVRGHFTEARNLFRELIARHPGATEVAARARTYLTIAETRLRSEPAAPRDAESLYDRGVFELNRGDYVAAQEMFERAVKRDPESADTHYALATARARLGSVEPALQALERSLQLKPTLRIRAQHDVDLAALRNDPEFERILSETTPS